MLSRQQQGGNGVVWSVVVVWLACVASLTATAAAGPVTDDACPSGADVNVLPTLPHLDWTFKPRSSNLGSGDYHVFDCPDEGTAGTEFCDTVTIHMDDIADPPEDDSVLYFLQALAMYPSLAALMFLLTSFGAFIFFICRCCCCCTRCCKRSCCCGCGNRWPTFQYKLEENKKPSDMTTKRKCAIGFRRQLGVSGLDFEYSPRQRWGTRVAMCVYVILTLVFIFLGEFSGNRALKPALEKVADSSEGFAQLVLDTVEPIDNFAIRFVSSAIVPTIQNLNDTVFTAVNLPDSRTHMVCIRDLILAAPTGTTLRDLANEALDTVDRAKNVSDIALSSIDTFDVVFDDLRASTNDALAFVNSIQPAVNNVSARYSDVLVAFEDIRTVNSTLSEPSSALYLPQLSSDVATVTDTASYPSSAAMSGTATGGTNSIQFMLGGGMDASRGDMTSLANDLSGYHTTVSAVPDASATSSRLASLNTLIDSTSLTPTIDALEDMEDAVAALPKPSGVTAIVDGMLTVFDDLDTAPMRFAVDEVESILANFTIIARLQAELDTIEDIQGVSPCLHDLVGVVDLIHENLLVVPDSFNESLTDVLRDVDENLASALDELADFRADLVPIQADIDAFSLTELADIRTTLDDLDSEVAGARTQLTDLNDTASSLGDSTLDVDLSPIIDQVNATEQELRDPDLRTPTGVITALDTMGTETTRFEVLTSAAAAHIAAFAGATCLAGPPAGCTAPCADGTPCPVASGSVEGCCTVDLNTTLLTDTRNQLVGFSSVVSSAPDTTELVTSIEALEAATATIPNPNDDQDDLQKVLDDAGALPLGTATTELEAVLTELNSGVEDDLQTVKADVVDLKSSLDDTPDRADVLRDVESAEQSLNDVREDGLSTVDDAIYHVDETIQLVQVDLKGYLARLSSSELHAVVNTAGMSGLIRRLADVGQDFIRSFNLVANDTVDTVLLDELGDVFKVTDVLSQTAPLVNGPVYFFYELANKSSVQPPFDTGYINEDLDGNSYPDDEVCVTSACIRRTIDKWNSQSLNEASDGSIPIDMSRQEVTSLLYLYPALILLLSCVGASMVCFSSNSKCGSLAYYPTCCATTLMCLGMPFMFLLAGFLFVVPLVGADYCLSAPNLGYQYLQGSMGGLCDSLDGTLDVSTGMCAASINLGSRISRDVDFEVNLLDTYSSIIAGCPGVGNSPLRPLFDSLRESLRDVPFEETRDELNKRVGEDWETRPPLRLVLETGANLTGDAFVTFVSEMEPLWSCNGFHEAYTTVEESMCCSTMNAVYWWVASWYMIAWLTCICGCGTGILGCKRFPSKVWGYEVNILRAERDVPATGSARFEVQSPMNKQGGVEMTARGGPQPQMGDPRGQRVAHLQHTPTPGQQQHHAYANTNGPRQQVEYRRPVADRSRSGRNVFRPNTTGGQRKPDNFNPV